MTGPGSPWVVHSSLEPAKATDDGRGVRVGGLLLLAAEAPATLRPRMLVDGVEVRARWNLSSPNAAGSHPQARNAGNARIRSPRLAPDGGRLEVVLEDGADGSRVVVAETTLPSRPLPPPLPADLRAIRTRLDELLAAGSRDPAQRRAVLKGLTKVPKDRRDAEWTEAAILADVHFREQPRTAFRRLTSLRRQYAEAGRQDTFDAFHEVVGRALAPYTLNAHGYKPALASRDERDVWREVAALTDHLADLGYQTFVNSGTLLGLARSGALIGHDDDVDLAVLMRARETAEVAAEWLALRTALADEGLLVGHFIGIHGKLHLPSGVSADLFPAWVDPQQRVFVYPHTCGEVDRDALLPLVPHEVAEVSVPLPREPARLLTVNYGPDWRVPDPTFAFDWRSAKQRFREFRLATHRLRHPGIPFDDADEYDDEEYEGTPP